MREVIPPPNFTAARTQGPMSSLPRCLTRDELGQERCLVRSVRISRAGRRQRLLAIETRHHSAAPNYPTRDEALGLACWRGTSGRDVKQINSCPLLWQLQAGNDVRYCTRRSAPAHLAHASFQPVSDLSVDLDL
jgi:hypothetical protein